MEKVWAVVHEDFKNAGKWTSSLDHVDILTDGPLGKGTELRYTMRPGCPGQARSWRLIARL